MTIEEAVKVIKENIDVYEECIGTKTGLMMPIERPDIEAFRIAIKALEELQAHREAWEKAKRTVKAYLMLEEFGVEYQDDIEKLIDGCRPKEGDVDERNSN